MQQSLTQLQARLASAALRVAGDLALMEVCGTHTVSAFKHGIHALLPANVRLLSGPGCPVCVTSQGDIDLLIGAASLPEATLCTYGDMLKVPGTRDSLQQARSRGADVRIIYSTLDAVKLAEAMPQRQVVLAAVGFETTTPATAVAILEAQKRGLRNFSVLASHKVLMPALHALLAGGKLRVTGLLCPGHASIIIGSEAFRPLVEMYGLPCVVAGFEAEQMLLGITRLVEMIAAGKPGLDNVYPQVVKPRGNRAAQAIIEKVFMPAPGSWRALGTIAASGLQLRPEFASYDAARRFGLAGSEAPEPAGCRCGEVITAQCTPADCTLFGKRCTPTTPVGPCMVSSEGSCVAWHKYGKHRELQMNTDRHG
jgi:hydrogenase expression/formation protein HypD